MKTTWIAQAVGLALVAQAGAAAAQGPTILSCTIVRPAATGGSASGVREERVFRIGPGSLQEWEQDVRHFGPNLCEVFACAANRDRSEGTITSASVAYTIGVDHKTGVGYWRSVVPVSGAIGAETKGACRQTADPSTPAP
jgi:hypothetical protein